MNRESALEKMLDYFDLQRDDDGGFELILRDITKTGPFDAMSLQIMADQFNIHEFVDSEIENSVTRLQEAFKKRYKRDLELFHQLFNMSRPWCKMALWNALPNMEYGLQMLSREDFSDDEWSLLDLRRRKESQYDFHNGKLCLKELSIGEVKLISCSQYDVLSSSIGGESQSVLEISSKLFSQDQWIKICSHANGSIRSVYPHSDFIMIAVDDSQDPLGCITLDYEQETRAIEMAFFYSGSGNSFVEEAWIRELSEMLINSELSYYEDNLDMSFMLRRKRIDIDLIRLCIPCDDAHLNRIASKVGYKKMGRISRHMPDMESDTSLDCYYYELDDLGLSFQDNVF